MEIDSEEERRYIAKLNKNIKESKKQAPKKKGKEDENKYQDLDHFFEQVVQQKIKEKEEDMKLNPLNFKKFLFVVFIFSTIF